LTGTVLVLAMCASGVLSQAAAAACQTKCGDAVAVAKSCCARHGETPEPQQSPDDRDDHRSRPCPASCPGCCTARPLAVPPVAVPVTGESAVAFTVLAPAAAVHPLDISFAIFHPPKV
jgi:hypothetical protein